MSNEHLLQDLAAAINTQSLDQKSGTPDCILAEYLRDCLEAFEKGLRNRTLWYGHDDASDLEIDRDRWRSRALHAEEHLRVALALLNQWLGEAQRGSCMSQCEDVMSLTRSFISTPKLGSMGE